MIDLRSDTVTLPTPAMKAAMLEAPLGDDVFGDDPTVNALQESLAARLGFAAGMFCPTGTQSNLCALMAHCGRGDEYIVGQEAHTYKFEGGGAAVLGSIQPQPLENAADGSLPLEKIAAAIKPDDPHFARTRLLALENTISGKVLPPSIVAASVALARQHGLATHLDGARFFNAAVSSLTSPRLSPDADRLTKTERDLAGGFDSISICLSKGLGTPAGSVLLGSRALIDKAIRIRKMLGGGMRQSGLLAAAGLYALKNHVTRLADDHDHAALLAGRLEAIPGLTIHGPCTNMVFVDVPSGTQTALAQFLKSQNILILPRPRLRLVLHLGIDTAAVHETADAIQRFYTTA
ncbi:MAG: low-specificity L-threonine aldolase [Verrucomicrobiales bacterium]|nr:low-specificity L-threonine aldolase [Verrucomicrobiales bacterium]